VLLSFYKLVQWCSKIGYRSVVGTQNAGNGGRNSYLMKLLTYRTAIFTRHIARWVLDRWRHHRTVNVRGVNSSLIALNSTLIPLLSVTYNSGTWILCCLPLCNVRPISFTVGFLVDAYGAWQPRLCNGLIGAFCVKWYALDNCLFAASEVYAKRLSLKLL